MYSRESSPHIIVRCSQGWFEPSEAVPHDRCEHLADTSRPLVCGARIAYNLYTPLSSSPSEFSFGLYFNSRPVFVPTIAQIANKHYDKASRMVILLPNSELTPEVSGILLHE